MSAVDARCGAGAGRLAGALSADALHLVLDLLQDAAVEAPMQELRHCGGGL
jgi:hypothetical protein